MKKLNVFFNKGKGDKDIIGQLALSRGRIFFEYDPDFLKKPLWLSPFKLPPEPGLKEHRDSAFGNLFGLFNDSLPDGWGLLLMNRFFQKKGFNISEITSIDRLAFLGSSTMGALTYEPSYDQENSDTQIFDLYELSRQSRQLSEGETDIVLPQLMRAGGSPGGARPKVLVGIHDRTMVSGEDDLPDNFQHWIIKFSAKNDFKDAANIEYAYSLMAIDAGIDMPKTKLFKVKSGEYFFGARRFDRKENHRFHVHTFGNLIHADFRIPSTDYSDFFKVVKILTKNHEDLIKAFRQMVFNVLTHNRDDHVKNFAFMIDKHQEWHLTPGYDITFSNGPGGEHSMTILGEGKSPGQRKMIEIGKQAGLSNQEISHSIDQAIESVHKWGEYARIAGVTDESMEYINDSIQTRLKE